MTTKERVHQLIEQLDDEQIVALERELVLLLEAEDALEQGALPYDPLGSLIGFIGPEDYDGPTDVSVDKYRYVADAIDPE